MNSNDKIYKSIAPNFWAKDEPMVIGDIEQRPSAVALLGEVIGKKILEAGCGTGYVARLIATKGAVVFGCDKEPAMLAKAKEFENKKPLGIKYDLCDITKTIYPDKFFSGICCVGVLLHSGEEEWKDFLFEAKRVLKDDGTLVISTEHPFLFSEKSPSRKEGINWIKHESLENKELSQSQIFRELYYDKNGQVFDSTVWYHPLPVLKNIIESASFKIEQEKEIMVKREHLLTPIWGKEYDYPAFIQFKLKVS